VSKRTFFSINSTATTFDNHSLYFGRCVPCNPCEARFRLTWCARTEDTACVDICPPGTYRHNGGAASIYSLGSCDLCTDRGSSYFSETAGQTVCSQCAAGLRSNGTSCVACGTSSSGSGCAQVLDPFKLFNNWVGARSFLWLLLV
jgi:hypothetical protein